MWFKKYIKIELKKICQILFESIDLKIEFENLIKCHLKIKFLNFIKKLEEIHTILTSISIFSSKIFTISRLFFSIAKCNGALFNNIIRISLKKFAI